MTKSVRYQDGQLYVHHGAWFVRYRVRVRQEDGSTRLQQKAKEHTQVSGTFSRFASSVGSITSTST